MPELIVALDFNDQKQALDMAVLLRPQIKWFKVGLELFISAGPPVILQLAKMDCRIFLDLKIYDIPNTAGAAARAARLPGVGLFTIHLQGGERMCAAVRQGMEGSGILCAGVTSLTSFNIGEMPGIRETPAEYGLYLAGKAQAWGIDAVVCAVSEAARIRQKAPHLSLICPGIRPGHASGDDQARIATPAQAIKAGADFLVAGRPIIKAPDPLAAASNILQEIRQAI